MDSNTQTEPGVIGVFTQIGGYRVGRNSLLCLNASWPFGSIEVRPGELILCCISRTLVFPATSITRISIYYGLFSSGIRIEHTIADYPRFVVYWSFNLAEL